jgi:CRP/FNR family cyclic AMP-dependent transcriptional regulator
MGAELLKNIYLFKDLKANEVEQIAALVKTETLAPRDEVFAEGDKAASLFIIKYGSVQIKRSGQNDGVEVARLATGAHFGEMSFVDGESRSATATTLEKTEILKIDFAELTAFFEKNPGIAVKFYRSLSLFLCGRLRMTTMDLSFAREKNIRHF